jgi:beta-lactamase regulating signal transducer with metallopeptidase domain
MIPALASIALGLTSVAGIFLTLRVWRLAGHARTRFAIWFVALVALAIVLPAWIVGSAWTRPAPVVLANDRIAPAATSAARLRPGREIPTTASLAAPIALPPQTRGRIDAPAVIFAVWLTGALVLLARAVLGLIRLRALMKSATLVETRVTARGIVRVVVADLFDVPVAVGYRHPSIVVPASVLALERETDLENVLLHELEHLRRFDDVTSLVQVACMCVLWFNPCAYLIAARLSIEREMACDEAVVAQTGKRAGYVATLWKMATCRPAGFTPEYISAFRSRSATVPRLDNLLGVPAATPKRRSRFALAAAIAMQALLIGIAIATPAVFASPSSVTAFARVRLAGGETLVVGGRNADGTASRYAQLYDSQGGRVALIATGVARWNATATRLQDGDVLVTGGVTGHGIVADAEIYETAARRFRPIAPMSVPRAGHTATLLLDGRVLVASGERSAGAYVKSTEIYDPRLERFVGTADGDGRVNEDALLVDRGSVLIYGGLNARGTQGHCTIIYDPALRAYRDGGRVVERTASAIVTQLDGGPVVRHPIRNA